LLQFGRLLCSLEDRGMMVLLDPRVRSQRYGQTFLVSLPPYRMTATVTDHLEAFLRRTAAKVGCINQVLKGRGSRRATSGAI
jgi:Rad3-related DNA helicase